jgi:hypothetical protein
VVWPAAQIPDQATWHPCLLAELRADNDDSAGGPNGCPLAAEGDTYACNFGSYFWGSNNICQRNVSYAMVSAGKVSRVTLPFLVGNSWSEARFLEIIVDKGSELADVPMVLHVDPKPAAGEVPSFHPSEVVFAEGGRALLRVEARDIGEIIATAGTIWRPSTRRPAGAPADETLFGGRRDGQDWRLVEPRSSVGFPIESGEMRRAALSFTTPTTLKPSDAALVRIFQRNDKRVVTGGVMLEVRIAGLMKRPGRRTDVKATLGESGARGPSPPHRGGRESKPARRRVTRSRRRAVQ